MKVNEQGAPIVEATDVLVAETDTGLAKDVQVYRDVNGQYQVVRANVLRHPNCAPEAAIIALTSYLHTEIGKLARCEAREIHRMKTPADSGPITGEAIKAKMMEICGCAGQHDCNCVTVYNQATQCLWTEHNQRQRLETTNTP